jgi:hypothetical protein
LPSASERIQFIWPASGFAASGTLLNSTLQGPMWLTGGKVGPEASVFSMLVLCVAMFCFHFLYPQANRPE